MMQKNNQQGGSPPDKPLVQVACGVLVNEQRQVWLLRRAPDQPRPAYWEFPGGKLEPGESGPAAMKRELIEELELRVDVLSLITRVRHSYPETITELLFYHCRPTDDSPAPVLHVHDAEAWASADELLAYRLLPGDRAVSKQVLIPWLRKLP